jgi:hypothetical protein
LPVLFLKAAYLLMVILFFKNYPKTSGALRPLRRRREIVP